MVEIELKRRVVYAGDVHNALLKAGCDIDEATDILASIPSADVAPVRHGRWVYSTTYRDADTCLCSECEQMMTTHHGERMPFCPGCGVDMRDGGADNETD